MRTSDRRAARVAFGLVVTAAVASGCLGLISTDDLTGGLCQPGDCAQDDAALALDGSAPAAGDATLADAFAGNANDGAVPADAADASDAVADGASTDATREDAGDDAAPDGFTVGGTVSGLGAGQSVTLLDNGSDTVRVVANGAFTFPTPLAEGAPYQVTTALSSGAGVVTSYVCGVTDGGSGTIGGSNVTRVVVSCLSSCVLFEGCVDGTNDIAVSADRLSAVQGGGAIGTHVGDCAMFSSQSGINLYNDAGIFVVDNVAYTGSASAVVSLATAGHFAVVAPIPSAGSVPAVSATSVTTTRGSVSVAATDTFALDDGPAGGAGYYEVYICK